MPGTGYYDRTTQTYKSLPTETWADYTNWSTFTSWAGTPADSVSFTTTIFDAGKVDWHNTLVDIEATLPHCQQMSPSTQEKHWNPQGK